MPARLDGIRISCVQARFDINSPAEGPTESTSKSRERFKAIHDLFIPIEDYKLVSLKCNLPSTGAAIKADELPVLIEQSGIVHPPVGIIASGKIGDDIVYEVDYCSATDPNSISIAEDGSVAEPFPETIWLTQKTESISEFYLLYLVKMKRHAIITSVRVNDSQFADFKQHEGFLVK